MPDKTITARRLLTDSAVVDYPVITFADDGTIAEISSDPKALAQQVDTLAAAFLAHMVMCGLLLAFGLACRFRLAYLIGWLLIVICLGLEHWIARRRSLNWINLAFFRLNALVGLVFLVVVAIEVIFQGGFRLR